MPAPLLAFHLTDRCQLNCQHCLRDPGGQPKDIPVDVLTRILDQGQRLYRVEHVSLTGGDPLLHPQLLDIVDAIAARGMTCRFVTNGKRLPRFLNDVDAVPTRRAAIATVNLSLDGADEVVHDEIRGAGSFNDVMAATSACNIRDLPFVLQMAVNRKNEHQIELFGLLAAQLGASRISFCMLQPTGTYLDEHLSMPAWKWKQIDERLQRLGGILKLPIAQPEGWYQEAPLHGCDPMKGEVLHVDVEGRLNLCCQHAGVPDDGRARDVAGDLKVMTLGQAHENLLDIIHEAQREKLKLVQTRELDEWEHFPCNQCLKAFGKPHWIEEGVGGPPASRQRWRGAWAPKGSATKKSPALNILA